MITISVVNLKGGVGKSTTAATMAQLLAARRKRVLLFDNDKQGNLSRLFKSYNRDEEKGACDILKYAVASGNIKQTENEYIHIIPCNYFMESAELEIKLDQLTTQHDRYKKALAAISGDYDYCIIDNPPDLGMNVINALVATDKIIIPLNLDAYSLDGLEEIVDQVNSIKAFNKKAKLAGCLITNYEKTETSEAAEMWLRTKSKFPVFNQKIRHSKKVSDSTFYQKTPLEYSVRCGASQDYKKFMQEYMAKERMEREGL